MSTKLAREGEQTVNLSGQVRDHFGLPVQGSVSPRKDKDVWAQPVTPRGQTYGVRVPVLNDLDGRYISKLKKNPCRFDIVEKVATLIQPGPYEPDDNTGLMTIKSPGRDSDENGGKLSRQPTFHGHMPGDQKDASVVDRIGPYHWNKYVKSFRESDARDVLYKNTYCLEPELLRYRSLTLPRISTPGNEDRPWTVSGEELSKANVKKSGDRQSKVVTIVPQNQRGTVVKFHECMKPYTYESQGQSLEVKRVNSRQNQQNHFTTVKSVFPLIRHDFRRSPKKQERPLKFENSRYIKEHKGTLFTKHILPAYKTAFDRDYSSADTFKEYLDSLQFAAKSNTPGMHAREMTGYRYYNEPKQSMDHHNQVLQYVSEVNQPIKSQDDSSANREQPMKIEIKQLKEPERATGEDVQKKVPTIDNLSSVRGSVVQGRRDSQSHLPMSSSVIGGKSIVKPNSVVLAKDEADKAPSIAGSEKAQSVVSVKSRLPEPVILPDAKEETPCPANTPTPED